MKNTSRYGNTKEVRTAEILQADGWVVGSRRHIKGPGDLIAHKPEERPRLIEVKAGAGGPYENFRVTPRHEMRAYAVEHGMVPELAWWAKGEDAPEFIDEASWP